jgi:hypothetical protein
MKFSIIYTGGPAVFFSSPGVQTSSGAHPSSYWMGTGAVNLGMRQLGCIPDHWPPSSAKFKNDGAIPLLSIHLYGMHKGSFTFVMSENTAKCECLFPEGSTVREFDSSTVREFDSSTVHPLECYIKTVQQTVQMFNKKCSYWCAIYCCNKIHPFLPSQFFLFLDLIAFVLVWTCNVMFLAKESQFVLW